MGAMNDINGGGPPDFTMLGRQLGQIAAQIAKKTVTDELAKAAGLTPSDFAALETTVRGAARQAVADALAATLSELDNRLTAVADGVDQKLYNTGNLTTNQVRAVQARVDEVRNELAQVAGQVGQAMQGVNQALELAPVVQSTLAASKATQEQLTEMANVPEGLFPVKYIARQGWQQSKTKSWPVGTAVAHNGAMWVAIGPVGPNDEPGITSKVWWQLSLLFSGFVGVTNSRAIRQAAATIPFFTQDSTNPPSPAPGNLVPLGAPATAHCRGWIATDSMVSYVAMQDSGGGWVWAESGGR